ncbi:MULTISPECIES: BREX system P-loop protein BrxC [Acinetobacter calcoaceticus/baumannii complex]|uniref:BREX system P-loop protein BrxC n=1 Tax=Acinetobacter calcoaceticus/baumannii complex TaxID=909768 RepID=UPI00157FE8B4|nr:BREX system P-loop protein BrxC [Acinetobacter lactucae]NUF37566.1 BREX system P-loop protein BrxC [Acinetobacter lactucae]
MNIKELFYKPLDRAINGVVKADQDDDATVYQELDEYVVTNELEKHFRDFFQSYGTDLSDPSIANRVGVWISGFFGSGKSHFLKTLSYILANKVAHDADGHERSAADFFDESKIRDAFIRADIGKAVSQHADVILFNIDSKASSNDDGNPILNVFLRVFNEYQGFSADHPHIAHMERHLSQKGVYETFKKAFEESSGMSWSEERDGYQFYQDDVEKAISHVLGLSSEAAHKWFEDSEQTFSVSVENFCQWVKEYLDSKGTQQRMLFLVDEVGQFIGSDTRLMLTLQTITENLGTICKGRAWIIVTSQADMDAVLGELSSSKANDFSKIAGRFKTRLSLSSSNTDEVIQKRLLRKKPEAETLLRAVFEQKGDILKNQISFDRSGPTLKNFDGADSFINNYPFAPYHFQLVQKVFEEIRKVGATGAHLAYGERSMLDAFQMAANAIATDEVGTLIPFHRFYASVEGFLDTAVKRTIDQAGGNKTLDSFDVQMLRTLFMIRYVDIIKGTLDNLVTLSIEKIDEDKLALRKRIEECLQRLEKESLITRNGDEFLFLTNEERDITRKIKATDLSASEENKELANLIFKDLLRDQNKYRHQANKMDYQIGRFLDGHSLDGKYESDLKVEIISPLDTEYSLYTEAFCIGQSAEAEGQILLKLTDDKLFFSELRTWLKTNKFIRLNDDGTQSDITRILADRGRENQERKKRLRTRIEEMLLDADCYALGQHLQLSSSSSTTKLDEACRYLLENTYNKLGYLQVYQQDAWRELNAVLTVDDMAQLGLSLDGAQSNPKALHEVEQYISLRATGTDRILVSDVIERFTKRPYGWPDAEILLLMGQLAAIGRISLQLNGGTLQLKDAFEPLQNSRRRRDVSIIKKRQTDDQVLKQARQLTQDLFSAMGPATEKELFEFYTQRLKNWLANFKSYKSKTDVGQFPGKKVIEQSILTLERLLANSDSFDFFKIVVENKDDYLDLEEDYRDIHEFFSNQLQSWQQLQHALRHFEKNKQALSNDPLAKTTLTELHRIATAESPYGLLNKVADLVRTVESVNERLLSGKRSHAVEQIDDKIKQLEVEIKNSGIATAELSNKLLRPLQLLKSDIEVESSLSNIFMLQTQTAVERFDEALYELEREVRLEIQRQATQLAQSKAESVSSNSTTFSTAKVSAATIPVQPAIVVVPPKPVVEVDVASIYSKTSNSVYLETEESVEQFIKVLEVELKKIVSDKKRVRIR